MKKMAIIGVGFVGKGMAELFEPAFQVHRYDPARGMHDKEQVNKADLAIVCVPTQSLPDGAADTSIVEEVVGWCGAELICIKSTVPPGTTDRLKRKYYGEKRIVFSPEFMGEGKNYVAPWKYPDPRDARSHGHVIVGGDPTDTSEMLDYYMKVMGTDARYVQCPALEAELTKYMINTYLAMKVTFCNEWSEIAGAFGADYKRIRELWLMDPRVDPGHTIVFKDSPGYGGKCLPKDTKAILEASRQMGYTPALLDTIDLTNDKRVNRAAAELLAPVLQKQGGFVA